MIAPSISGSTPAPFDTPLWLQWILFTTFIIPVAIGIGTVMYTLLFPPKCHHDENCPHRTKPERHRRVDP